MGTNSVNKIPSRSLPFVDKQGRINPTWYEYLRKFIADSAQTTGSSPAVTVDSIVAGQGLTSTTTGNNITLAVGAGNALAVNANDVALDINNLSQVQGTLDDEIAISRPADNNSIKKTRLRDVAGLSSPGGNPSNIQYNDSGVFAGSSSFTYDGANTVVLSTLTVNGTTFSSATNADKFVFQVPSGSSTTHFTFEQSGTSSSTMPVDMKSYGSDVALLLTNNSGSTASTTAQSYINFKSKTTVKWTIGLTSEAVGSTFTLGTTATNAGNVFTVDATNRFFAINTALTRKTTASITASTTQTQGQGALTSEVNEVSTCANANDTVTLPGAVAGRYCLVINNGAQTLQVFPASGDDLGAGVDTATTIATTSRKMFVAFDGTNWEPVV